MTGWSNINSVYGNIYRAFLYTGGTMNDLGTLGGLFSYGYGINNVGQVTGSSQTSDGPSRAFLYSDGTMNDLGTLGGHSSEGRGINESGQVTGWSYTSGISAYRAFLYSGGTMNDLGSLGGMYSLGLGINDAGHVTGWSFTSDTSAQHAFLYRGGTMYDLNNLIDPLSGWILESASDINNLGQITGHGIINNQRRAFVLTPLSTAAVPEPATWAMMMLGFGMIGGAMRLRKQQVRDRYT